MTRQEIFNKIWQTFVVEQAPRGINPDRPGACAYITAYGARCAVGVILTEEEAWAMAQHDNQEVDVSDALPVRFKDDRDFLGALQLLHDIQWAPDRGKSEAGVIHRRKDSARAFAVEWYLEVPK